jgi:O-antigen/teichoic acid export membrane protein
MAIGSILVGRFLGSELYGQYTLTLVIPQILLIFTDLGINQGIIKFTASLRAKGENERITKIIKYGTLLKTAVGIVIFIASYALTDLLAPLFLQRPELSPYIKIASASIVFQAVFTTVTSAFIGLDRAEYNALTTTIQAISKTTISVTLILLGFSLTGAVMGHVASLIIATAISILLLLPITRGKPNVKNNHNVSEDLKTLIRYGAPLYISSLLVGFIPLYKNMLLAIFTTDIEIGNYKAALNFTALMTVLSAPITTTLLPAFSKLNSTANRKVKDFFKIANKYTAMIIVPVICLIIIFSKEIVQFIYGVTYQSAPKYLALYCLIYFLVGIGYLTLTSLYNGLGETKKTMKISLVTFIVLATLSLPLTKAYGVQGLIIAYIIANTMGTLYGAYIAKKDFQIEFDKKSIAKIYLISAASSIPPATLLSSIPLHGIFKIAVGGTLYLIGYLTLMPLTKTVVPHEIQKAEYIMKKIKILEIIARPLLKYQRRILSMMQFLNI